MGVSNAWAKRYYFEVPDIAEWKGEDALYAVRLCKGAGINTGTAWERLTQWDENTYYMDFKSNTYTHFQFCRMKDDITSLEGSSWMNLQYTSCYTMPSPIQTNEDEPNLLVVGEPETYNNSYQSQPYSSNWDYQTFTAEDVHIIFEVGGDFWRNAPKLLIGDKTSSQTFEVNPIENSSTIYHYHIVGPITYTGYTFIQPEEALNTSDETPFHTRCTQIDNQIYTWNSGWYPDNESQEDKLTKYNFTSFDSKSYQQIILDKDNDEMSYIMYRDIVYYIKTRTRSYYEPITDNVFHKYNPGDEVDSKTYFDDIEDLNKTLTIEVKVSYDDGKTYEQTGTLPLTFLSEYFPKRDIGGVFWRFTNDWNRMSESNTFNLPKGGKTFSYTTPMGYKARNVNIAYKDLDRDKYVIDKWIINNTPTPDSQDHNKFYQPGHFEEENPVITLYIKKINNWQCTVNFNTDDLDHINITDQIINPNTTATPPVIAPELQPVGMICKWYTGVGGSGEEFDFDTHITEDITLYGMWVPEAEEGDYRLLYVEQVVEKSKDSGNEWKTIITRKKAHPSDIIKKGTPSQIVSLHVYKERKYNDANAGNGTTYESSSNPEIILQQYQKVGEVHNWVNIERHMVLGPLETLPGMAMAPGRRNAAANAELVYDDGIEIIKNDSEAGRVWNFTVKQEDGVVSLPLDDDNLKPYEGNYYIRTAKAEGGWNNYKISANHMTFSDYAKVHSGFSHYFCKWVDIAQTKNIRFVIANDYGLAISDTLSGDLYTDEYGNISESANIRWSWNEITNAIARAYIQGTWDSNKQRNNNLVVNYKSYSSAADATALLDDSGDWIYQNNFTVKVGSHLNSLTAQYPVTTGHTQTFAESLDMLTGDEQNTSDYVVRVLYDFKINKTLVTLVPNQNNANIGIDVLIERIDQNKPATQVQTPINAARTAEGSTVYAVMSFTKDHLTSNSKSNEEKLTYWFSLPFDVTLSDVFGFGEVGQYWMIKYYDGEERAQKGLLDDNTFWKYITKKSTVLEANKGYVLALNKKVMDSNSPIFTNTNKISLYFPSTQLIKEINTGYTQTTCSIPVHKCDMTSPTDRRIYDSNWNFIGVPSYADKNETTTNENVKYFYDYDHASDSYTVTANGGPKTFNSMFAYMVQFAGTIDWSRFTFNGAQGLAAKKANAAYNQHNLRLELQQSGSKLDHTFIQLQDEEATEMFDMNSDLCKIINAGSNIYSIITTESTPIQVAGNVMPTQETIIPIGIVTSAAGEYTFAMPEGTDGIVVEFIDYETNTRTNMLLDEYTVNLGKGTFDNRFALHVKPDKVTTSLEDVNTNTTGVKKYLIDGVLYMQKDGVLYDAQGKLVR